MSHHLWMYNQLTSDSPFKKHTEAYFQSPKDVIPSIINTLRPRQNGRHLADDMFECIFLDENVWILIDISLKFVPKGSINNDPALFQIMAWCRAGDKPLSEPMMVSWLTHICVTRPQWVNTTWAQNGKIFTFTLSHTSITDEPLNNM